MFPLYTDLISGASGRRRLSSIPPLIAERGPVIAGAERVILGAATVPGLPVRPSPVSTTEHPGAPTLVARVPLTVKTWNLFQADASSDEIAAVLAELNGRNVFSAGQRIELRVTPDLALIFGVDTGLYWEKIGRSYYTEGASKNFRGVIRFPSPQYLADNVFAQVVRNSIAGARHAVGKDVAKLTTVAYNVAHQGALKKHRPAAKDIADVLRRLF